MKLRNQELSIVTVGGGSGSPVVHEALLSARVTEITAIAAPFDSGGATGKRRLDARGKEIAYSDPMRIMFSLVPLDQRESDLYQVIQFMFNHRDADRQHVLGQEIFSHFYNAQTGFQDMQALLERLGLRLCGNVYPSALLPADIEFLTQSGRKFHGEHYFDEQSMSADSVTEMWLNPQVEANPAAMDALRKAARIILSCGSLYGSVLANFLPVGMKEALAQSNAEIYLITNLMSTRNETHQYTPEDFVATVERYTGRRVHGLLIPNMTQAAFDLAYPDVAQYYALEQAHFLGWDDETIHQIEAKGIRVIRHDAMSVVASPGHSPVVRHNPQKLAEALHEIL